MSTFAFAQTREGATMEGPVLRTLQPPGPTIPRPMVTKTTSKKADKAEFVLRLEKARGRIATATKVVGEDPDSAYVLSIQGSIAAADALTIRFLEERSSSQGHTDLLTLLKRTNLPGLATAAKDLQKVLAKKSLVEYGSKTVKPKDAAGAVEKARSFLAYVEARLAEA